MDTSDDERPQQRARRPRRSSVGDWNPSELYTPSPSGPSRPPPSSYAFSFQAYPGNPDPGTSIPSNGYSISSRRSSIESISNMPHLRRSLNVSDDPHAPPLSPESDDLGPPNAPFMSESGHGHSPSGSSASPTNGSPNPNNNAVYRGSVGASLVSHASNPNLNESSRNNSAIFRAPFLSPSSRPSSSIWAPPSYPYPQSRGGSPAASSTALAMGIPKGKPPLPSNALSQKLTKADKPWLSKPQPRERLSYFLTVLGIFAGLAGAALLCFFELRSLDLLDDSSLCVVLEDQFNTGSLDTSVWKRTVAMGGFGNGEFEIMTDKDENLKIQNNNLYIIPTLTSESIGGTDSIFDGYTYDLGDACTTDNKTACSVTSDKDSKTTVPPVQSALISTNGTKSIKYGRVQVRAKLPRGDWLWPAIWMLPTDSKYGQWPLSGEIDLMEARGNDASYGAQGVNYVRSSLNYAPLAALRTQIYGWWTMKRSGFNAAFHTYTLEWDPSFMRMYVDSRLHATLDFSIKKEKDSFFNRGKYPPTALNGTGGQTVAVTDIWSEQGGGWNAPFDQDFYLIISLAAGGTSGWFPDGVGGKPWADGSAEAQYDFAKEQGTWSGTWPTSEDDRALRVDWVKMWGTC